MAAESKKFSMLCCSMMTMQALRLVISTAGFCVVRFHIDCALFNIFISRLVNAVMMSQLFGNWLGDLTVFTLDGTFKMVAAVLADWAELICFCTALYCIVHTECGHLTGFYWSMVLAYFWWKVSEAPTTSIAAPNTTDYYFSGFTLSGVWAAMLKWVVMWFVAGAGAKPLHFDSKSLGDVNVTVVGARSVKTTVDYRAAKWLYIITIALTFLMCVEWTWIAAVVREEPGGSTSNIKAGLTKPSQERVLGWVTGGVMASILSVPGAQLGAGVGWVFVVCFKRCLSAASYVKLTKRFQLIFGIVGALGTLGGVTYAIGQTIETTVNTDKEAVSTTDEWKGKSSANGNVAQSTAEWDKWTWIEKEKWKWQGVKIKDARKSGNPGEGEGVGWVIAFAAMIGLVVGTAAGALVGRCIGAAKGSNRSGFWAGALIGGFVGLLTGEIVNGAMNGTEAKDSTVWSCGILIVVLGLGTVYSIYPGMAPCSITQFQYFNIIDILILILSSIGPLVIMYADLKEEEWRLGLSILAAKDDKWRWLGFGVVFLLATLICEIIVLDIMQHPFSKMAQKVTTSGWRAVLLTVTMVTSQLVSSGIGFGCVAAGSMFNDGVVNVNSTLVLWTVECCGVLGEGYLTELKKYEPGKWPTQGMGKWTTYKWWNRKAFGNAWQIWCCIGTTDLRRDIMLCRQ